MSLFNYQLFLLQAVSADFPQWRHHSPRGLDQWRPLPVLSAKGPTNHSVSSVTSLFSAWTWPMAPTSRAVCKRTNHSVCIISDVTILSVDWPIASTSRAVWKKNNHSVSSVTSPFLGVDVTIWANLPSHRKKNQSERSWRPHSSLDAQLSCCLLQKLSKPIRESLTVASLWSVFCNTFLELVEDFIFLDGIFSGKYLILFTVHYKKISSLITHLPHKKPPSIVRVYHKFVIIWLFILQCFSKLNSGWSSYNERSPWSTQWSHRPGASERPCRPWTPWRSWCRTPPSSPLYKYIVFQNSYNISDYQ